MTEAILDTHTLLWAIASPDKLGLKAKKFLESNSSTLYCSAATFWEIVIKISIKKLEMDLSYPQLVKEAVKTLGIKILPIETDYFEVLISLPFHHRDPFDRLIVATAIYLKIPVISKDHHMSLYPVKQIW